ncbi:LLM class flavin-dependent oxidoreductase [Longispora sp. NPDC051575]|uniref:LLM class flavin-dependent oxidoreductase n=1 Tax=Longispora sp. NPDC051575 TaxID=3154943 RepID=UPI003431CEFE
MTRVDVMMWPTAPWAEARADWLLAEELGFGRAWLFDHVAWRDLRPWFDAYPTLAAAAAVTSRIGLGTMVTAPGFRHPVTTAKAALAIDDISGGRFTLGVGAGGNSSDVRVTGEGPWPPREKADRFAEWVGLVDTLLSTSETTFHGKHWSAENAWTGGRLPRIPLAVAGTGPRGLRLAATHAQTWITQDVGEVPAQVERLDAACAETGRTVERLILLGTGDSRPLDSVEAFRDCVGRYTRMGFSAVVVHWPRAEGHFKADFRVLEAVAAAFNPVG